MTRWFEKTEDMTDEFYWAESSNKGTDRKIAMGWLQRNFGPGRKTVVKENGNLRLLYFDGHSSHVTEEFFAI